MLNDSTFKRCFNSGDKNDSNLENSSDKGDPILFQN